jgi:hypothetical protein
MPNYVATVTTSVVVLRASVPARMREIIDGPRCRGIVLARFPTALYVAVPRGFGVMAVLSRDAVRLPCGVQLASPQLDLPDGDVLIGAGGIRVGAVEIAPGRIVSTRVAPRRAPALAPDIWRAAVALAPGTWWPVDVSAPERLLGRGPGLTPSGDDALAGYLVGAAAYGLPAGVRDYVEAHAHRRTSTLSAALLRHAAVGETIPQVTRLLDALDGQGRLDRALRELAAVGHTSGAALASGVLAAADAASARMTA